MDKDLRLLILAVITGLFIGLLISLMAWTILGESILKL